MYTPDEGKEIIFNYLDVTAITGIIAGSVCYSDCRPEGSTEDVTIGAITLTDNSGANSTQRGTFNVNIYIKDIPVEYNNGFLNQPNNARFKLISKAVINALQGPDQQGLYWETGNLWISNVSGTLKLEATKEHYINIRVEMKLHEEQLTN